MIWPTGKADNNSKKMDCDVLRNPFMIFYAQKNSLILIQLHMTAAGSLFL